MRASTDLGDNCLGESANLLLAVRVREAHNVTLVV
jgi:hypothetical protein